MTKFFFQEINYIFPRTLTICPFVCLFTTLGQPDDSQSVGAALRPRASGATRQISGRREEGQVDGERARAGHRGTDDQWSAEKGRGGPGQILAQIKHWPQSGEGVVGQRDYP